MANSERPSVEQKVVEELRKFSLIVSYVWAVLLLLELHRFAIFRELNQTPRIDYRIWFTLINALVLGKVILLAQDLHVGEQLKVNQLVLSILFKSAVYAVLLLCFNVIEEVIIGVLHGKTIVESVPGLGGGGLEGKLIVATIMFVFFIPFFAFTEIRRVLGKEKVRSFMLEKRSSG
jgi:hypothetical protein